MADTLALGSASARVKHTTSAEPTRATPLDSAQALVSDADSVVLAMWYVSTCAASLLPLAGTHPRMASAGAMRLAAAANASDT